MRRFVRENVLTRSDLVYPLFVCPGRDIQNPIAAMRGCYHYSPDRAVAEASAVAELGIPAVLLFGIPSQKDAQGSEAWSPKGAVALAVGAIKKACPDLLVMTDCCLCAYTDHGHCGVLADHRIKNDDTCALLAKVALCHAEAGADIVAPSDMMDGRIGAMRQALEKNGFPEVAIMSYAAKYASAYYGPFRDAADSTPSFGDRRSYQMDPGNAREALAEMALDVEEGADMLMVKPALPYLDIICRARQSFHLPIAAYNVSGEYMMLHDAADAGHLDREAAMMEMLLSIKRAGADIIITYFAKEAAGLL